MAEGETHKYKVGDIVTYVNDYGVNWGPTLITGLGPIRVYNSVTYFYYYKEILGVEKSAQALWFPVKEQNLS